MPDVNAGTVFATLKLRWSDFKRGLVQANAAAEAASRRMEQDFGRVLAAAGRLGSTLLGVGAAGAGLGVAAGKVAAGLEQTQTAFKGLLQSGEAAERMLRELQQFAASTPFEMTQVTDATRKLLAFGFAARDILPMLRDVGDAVAAMGGGAEMMQSVIRALGQMQAKGKVSAEEMLQLAEAGIPAWQMLAEAIGKSTAETQELVTDGVVPAEQAIRSLLAGMRERFGGQMAEQAKTAAGAWSNFRDVVTQSAAVMGEVFLPTAKQALSEITGWLSSLTEEQKKSLAQWGLYATAAALAVGALLKLAASLATLREGLALLTAFQFGPWAMGVTAALAVVAGGYALLKRAREAEAAEADRQVRELEREKQERAAAAGRLAQLAEQYVALSRGMRESAGSTEALRSVKEQIRRELERVRTELGLNIAKWDGQTSSIRAAIAALEDYSAIEKRVLLLQAQQRVRVARQDEKEAQERLQTQGKWAAQVVRHTTKFGPGEYVRRMASERVDELQFAATMATAARELAEQELVRLQQELAHPGNAKPKRETTGEFGFSQKEKRPKEKRDRAAEEAAHDAALAVRGAETLREQEARAAGAESYLRYARGKERAYLAELGKLTGGRPANEWLRVATPARRRRYYELANERLAWRERATATERELAAERQAQQQAREALAARLAARELDLTGDGTSLREQAAQLRPIVDRRRQELEGLTGGKPVAQAVAAAKPEVANRILDAEAAWRQARDERERVRARLREERERRLRQAVDAVREAYAKGLPASEALVRLQELSREEGVSREARAAIERAQREIEEEEARKAARRREELAQATLMLQEEWVIDARFAQAKLEEIRQQARTPEERERIDAALVAARELGQRRTREQWALAREGMGHTVARAKLRGAWSRQEEIEAQRGYVAELEQAPDGETPKEAAERLVALERERLELVRLERAEWEETFGRLGEALWDFRRDRAAVRSYARSVAGEFEEKVFRRWWDELAGEEGALARWWEKLTGPKGALTGLLGGLGVKDVGARERLAQELPGYAAMAYALVDGERGASGGALSGAVTGAQLGSKIPGVGILAGGVLGGLAGLLLGDRAERRRAEREARRLMEAQLRELKRVNHALTPVADYFRSMSLSMLPGTLTFGAAALADGYAAMSSRGAR